MPKVLIAIKSCHRYADRRAACTATWLPQVDWADRVFLLGRPVPGAIPSNVLACDVSDAFTDIAPKVAVACMYALANNFTHLFVCDDDTYVRPDRLAKCGYENHDYIGFMRVNGIDYNKGIPYAQGSAFWLSARAMEIVATSPVMQPGIIDDGAVGQALIDKVAFVHDYRYQPGPNITFDIAPHPTNKIITAHKAQPALMHTLHKPWGKKA